MSEKNLSLQTWWHSLTDEEFHATFRMKRETFVSLQAEIDEIEDQYNDTVNVNLLASVWILGNTEPFEEAKKLFGIKENVYKTLELYLHKIIKLTPKYIIWPDEKECTMIEKGFGSEFGFPGVLGVIGTIHISINPEKFENKESYYNPQMESYTIVLQVVCDNNLLLRDVCAGCPGGRSVTSILECSPLYQILTKDSYMIENKKHILGGTEHPMLPTLITPYSINSDTNLTKGQLKFNQLLNSVMIIVERTLTCLENRFPRLTAVDNLSPQLSTLIITAICILHNFTRVRQDNFEFN